MAVLSKKDKLIEDAQKFVLRGQLDKAIKVYEQIVALEPAAMNLRQKMAELMNKAGRVEDAVKELDYIGKNYAKNGFLLKAIAVYKHIQKIAPADITTSITLAELNEKHGLTANALSEYKQVYAHYEKSGNIPECLKTLDKMQHVDPQNISIKLKLAETYAQHDRKDDAYILFGKIASILRERGDAAAVARLETRIQEIFPEKAEFVLEVLSEQVTSGNAAAAVISLQALLRSNPNNKRAWDLVIKAYKRLQQNQRVRIACQHYLKYFPADPQPMLGLICCAVEADELAAALDLLNGFENTLISSGLTEELGNIYTALDKLDPINIAVLEGRIRLANHTGNDQELHLLSSRLESLCGTPEKNQSTVNSSQSGDVFPENLPQGLTPEPESLPITDFAAPSSDLSDFSVELPNFSGDFSAIDGTASVSDDDEIEIEIDVDSDFVLPDSAVAAITPKADWLDSVGDMLDAIATSPRGVKFGNEMDSSDAQSHYDLGQAFKEMGLYDEAINEFRQASQDDMSRRLECLLLQAACLRERNDFDTAITMLLALLQPGISIEDSCSVKYELVLTHQSRGETDAATQLLNEIYSLNPDFRDVSSRINSATLSEGLEFSDDDLKDFDLK